MLQVLCNQGADLWLAQKTGTVPLVEMVMPSGSKGAIKLAMFVLWKLFEISLPVFLGRIKTMFNQPGIAFVVPLLERMQGNRIGGSKRDEVIGVTSTPSLGLKKWKSMPGTSVT